MPHRILCLRQVRKAMVMRSDVLEFNMMRKKKAETGDDGERSWLRMAFLAKLRSGIESFADLDGPEESRFLGIWETFGSYLPEGGGILDVAWRRTTTSIQLLVRPLLLLTVGDRHRPTGTGFVIFNSFQAKVMDVPARGASRGERVGGTGRGPKRWR